MKDSSNNPFQNKNDTPTYHPHQQENFPTSLLHDQDQAFQKHQSQQKINFESQEKKENTLCNTKILEQQQKDFKKYQEFEFLQKQQEMNKKSSFFEKIKKNPIIIFIFGFFLFIILFIILL
jgi:uncharacterized membrane protein